MYTPYNINFCIYSPGVVPRSASLRFWCDRDIISMNKNKILGMMCPFIDTVGDDEAKATL